jgi:protein-arginine kinase activator protein McsA
MIISELHEISERIARYDIEKQKSIHDEDYEKAQFLKDQIKDMRTEIYKRLQKLDLIQVQPQLYSQIKCIKL